MRIGLLALGLVSLTGCYEFAGELEKLGFNSNMVVDGGLDWTPDHPIANGALAEFKAVDVVGQDVDGELPVNGTVAGLTTRFSDGPTLGITGRDGRARVQFEGAHRDHFRVSFRAPVGAELVDVLAVAHGAADTAFPEDFGLLAGSSREIGVSLRDRRGRALGYVAEDLVLSGEGAVSGWYVDGEHRLVAEEAGVSTIQVGHGDQWFATSRVHTVAAAEVVSLVLHHTIHFFETEEGRGQSLVVWVEGRTEEGLPVYGIPVDWSLESEADHSGHPVPDGIQIILEDGALDLGIAARWEDLEVTTRISG